MAMTDTERIHELMPLCRELGMRVERFDAGAVVMALDWEARLCTSFGVLHGGVLMSLADSAGGACAFLNLPEGASGTATIESKTNFLAALREGASATATSRPVHVGSRTIVIETDVHAGDRLVSKTLQTQAVL